MKRKITITILITLFLVTLIAFAGCRKEPLKAEFKPEINEAVCYYKEEFDLEPFIDKQDGVTYSIVAEQIDSDTFEVAELDVNGLKFKAMTLEDVLVTLTAIRGGEKVKSNEISIPVTIKVDELTAYLNNTWCDVGINRSINTDEKYIKTGASISTKVEWFGSEKSNKDRFQYFISPLGNHVNQCFSVTDWTDAVLTFWVYNDSDYDLEIAPDWTHDGMNARLRSDLRTVQIAKANDWTEIKYSLRYYGITEDWFYDEGIYYTQTSMHWGYGYDTEDGNKNINQNWWTCRWGGREVAGKIYNYVFYVDGFNIRNYDAAFDAELEHEYRGFWNQPIKQGFGTTIDIPVVEDRTTLSFEYKVVGGTDFGVALIGDDWSKNYYGYFFFNENGGRDAYSGVTITETDDGFKKVTFELSALTVIYGEESPEVLKKFFIHPGWNHADVIIRNVG